MSALIRVQPSATSAQLRPGEQVDFTLTVQNFSEIVDRYKITVDGVDSSWVSISRAEISLFPKDQDQVRVTLHPPSGTEAQAGHYDLRVQVVSQENPGERTAVPFSLEIAALTALELRLRPQKQSGVSEGIFTLEIGNQGNTNLTVNLAASDPEEGCVYTFNPPQVAVPAGRQQLVQVHVRPRQPLPGKVARLYSFTITGRPAEAPQQAGQVQGQWEQLAPSRRARWPIVVAVAVGLVALAVAAFFLLRPLWGRGAAVAEVPTIAVPTEMIPTTVAPSVVVPPTAVPTTGVPPTTVPTVDAAGTAQVVAQATATAQAALQATADAQATATSDVDGDGLTYQEEMELGTDPADPDSDGDGLVDGTDPAPLVADLPDLIVEGITIEEGDKIQCAYRNDSAVPVPEGTLRIGIYADDVQVSHSTLSTPIGPARGGWLRTASLELPPVVVVRCVIDADGDVTEAEEGNNERTVSLNPSRATISFGKLPDGTLVTDTRLLTGNEFSAWGLMLYAAPEGDYCADAQPAIRIAARGAYLSTARASNIASCSGVPVRIDFADPVRSVTVRFTGAEVDYVLSAYSTVGGRRRLLGSVSRLGDLSDLVEVTYTSDAPNINQVIFGHQAANTQVFQVVIER